MEAKNRHDRFYIARFKRAKKIKKRKPFLKMHNNKNINPYTGSLDMDFFTSRKERKERIDGLKINKSIEIEQIMDAGRTVKKQKGKKKYWSFLFLLINIGVIAAILNNQAEVHGFTSFSELIDSGANFNYIYLALLGFPLLTLIDWARFYLLLYKATGRSRHFLSYKVAALGRYYDLLTPLGTGGQPFQVYYLNKRSVKSQIATSVPLAKYIFSQTTFVTIALIALFTNLNTTGNNVLVVSAAWIGVGLNVLLLSGVLILSISKKIAPKITKSVLKLLNKLRIVKNYEVVFDKVMKFVKEYQKSMRYFASNLFIVLVSFLISILYIFIQGTIPFLIYSAFNGYDPSMWWIILSKLVMLEFAVSFVPLPGGAGAAELSFTAMFAALFEGGSFFWAILIWRAIVYYAFILQGLIVIFYDMAIGNKKAEKLKKIGFWHELPNKIKLPAFKNKNRHKNKNTVDIKKEKQKKDKGS